jgi:2'-5' RNA ligase
VHVPNALAHLIQNRCGLQHRGAEFYRTFIAGYISSILGGKLGWKPFTGATHDQPMEQRPTYRAGFALDIALAVCRMPESAFIVSVPEAEGLVASLRERLDASARIGVPAHITVLVPFMSPEAITPAVLGAAQGALNRVRSFAFSLAEVGCFPATAYLAPEPAEPFVALTESLVRAFPEFPPFRGEHSSIVPHLTVATGNAAEAELAAVEIAALVQSHGAVNSVCSSVALLENSSGLWKQMHVFALPGRPANHSGKRTVPGVPGFAAYLKR